MSHSNFKNDKKIYIYLAYSKYLNLHNNNRNGFFNDSFKKFSSNTDHYKNRKLLNINTINMQDT